MDSPQAILLHGFRISEGTSFSDQTPKEAWFQIKFTPEGAVLTEIFQKLPRNQVAESYCWRSSCVRLGSSLYVLGGARGPNWQDRATDSVRRLDINNPSDGWMPCGPLLFPCSLANVGVSSDIIYIFPQIFHGTNFRGGIYYNTSNEMAYKIPCEPPGYPHVQDWKNSVCFGFDFAYENYGVSALLDGSSRLSAYYKEKRDWKEWFKIPLPTSSELPPDHAFLNRILYLSYYNRDTTTTTLYAFNVKSGEQLLGNGKGVKLPDFEKLKEPSESRIFLVALADFKLCYLWSVPEQDYGWRTVYLATVVVTADLLSATIVSKNMFLVNAFDIQSCITIDADRNEEICMPWERADVEEKPRWKSSRVISKLKQGKESLRHNNRCLDQQVVKETESGHGGLLNKLRSKEGKLKMVVRILKLIKKNRSLEKKLKALKDSRLNKEHQKHV